MKCSKCGNTLREGCVFCGACGTPVSYIQTPPTPQPQQTPQAQPATHRKIVGKNRYFLFAAPLQIKLMSIISLALALLCISLLAISSVQVMDTPIDEINVVNYSLKLTGFEKEYKNVMLDLKEVTTDLEKYSPISENIDNRDLRRLSVLVNDLITFVSTPSLNNAKDTIDSYGNLNIKVFNDDENYFEALDWIDNLVDPAESILSLIETGIYISMAIPAILLILGFALKSNGFSITGAVFAILFSLCIAETSIFILTIVSIVLAIVLLIMCNNDYKKYAHSFR